VSPAEAIPARRDDLLAFFERYARTFQEDVGRFCDLYEFPCVTTRLDGSVERFVTRDDAVRFFAAAKRRYEDEGCRRWAIRRLDVEPRRSEDVVIIDWDMLDTEGVAIRGWRQSYDVVRRHSDWKVRGSTLHAGSERAYRQATKAPP
jgi:hypothetical protein